MSNISINLSSTSDSGLNIQQLKQSEYLGDTEYRELLSNNDSSLTQVYGEDGNAIFKAAYLNLPLNELQSRALHQFQEVFCSIEKLIDPERLKFSITVAMDDEVCINRKAVSGGRAKLIINDDGVIAISFLPDKTNSNGKKVLDFYILGETADFELLAYQFFSF